MTKDQVKELQARLIKDVDQLFAHIAGLDMACDEAIDWGKMAEIDMRKAQAQLMIARRWMWINHGCKITTLYGDDGEMQCNNMARHKCIDFKRDPVEQILRVLYPEAPQPEDFEAEGGNLGAKGV